MALASTPGPLGEYLKAKQSIHQLKAERADFSLTLKRQAPCHRGAR